MYQKVFAALCFGLEIFNSSERLRAIMALLFIFIFNFSFILYFYFFLFHLAFFNCFDFILFGLNIFYFSQME